MHSVEQFLQLLAEKDLVSPSVIEAVRREMDNAPSPWDAAAAARWMVKNQHLTPAQADRLLAAIAGKAERPSRPAPPASDDDLDLAPLDDEPRAATPVKKPASPPPPSTSDSGISKPGGAKPAGEKPAKSKSGKAADIAGQLDSSAGAMKGPLDALIESEAGLADPFADPMGAGFGPTLGAPVSKKFKFRRWFRNLFRRDKSKTVRIEAVDPKKIRLALITWGIAVVLALAVLVGFWAFSPRNSEDVYHDAADCFVREKYDETIAFCDRFLKDYPKLTRADDIRVLRGLAELRRAAQTAASTGNWSPAGEVAKKQMATLPKEMSYPESSDKVGVALATIAEGLARQSQAQPGADLVSQARSVVMLINTHVPDRRRPTEMIAEINHILEKTDREAGRISDLTETLAEISTAVGSGESKGAYTAYVKLMAQYPELADDAKLVEAMATVSAIEQKAVKVAAQRQAATAGPRATDLLASRPLAVRPLPGEAPAPQGMRVFVADQGAVFGLDAATGKVLWRQSSPADAKAPVLPPLAIAGQGGTDAIVCDTLHHEVMRLNGASGQVAWRQPLGRPITAEPARVGDRLLVTTDDRKVRYLDLASGDEVGRVELPQVVRLPAVVDAARGLVFLVAEQANLYVLDKSECRLVFHLGHTAGKIAAPPALVGNCLFVAVNDGAGEGTLQIVAVKAAAADDKNPSPPAPLPQGERGVKLKTLQRLPYKGNVKTAPAAVGKCVVLATAQGGLIAVEPDPSDPKLPFRVAATAEAVGDEKVARYLVAQGENLWVADNQLVRYEIEAARRIVSRAISDLGPRFVQPPTLAGGTLFCACRRGKVPGIMVSALRPQGQEPIWQTWLAAPLAAAPIADAAGKLTAVTASGGMFQLAAGEAGQGGPSPEPLLAVEPARLTRPISAVTALPGGILAMTSGVDTQQVAIYDPQESGNRFHFLLSPKEFACDPCGMGNGLLAACVNGQVFWLDPRAVRDSLAKPLAPPVEGVKNWEWRRPAVVGDKVAVLCDGDKRLITMKVSTDGEPALVATATITTAKTLVSPVAVAGKSAFVVDATDKLVAYSLPELAAGRQHALEGHCVFGPLRVGKLVLLATDKDRLYAFDEGQALVWQAPLPYGPLAGEPWAEGEDLFLAARGGVVWRLSAADGKERGKVDAGCPLGTGPVVVGQRLVVGGAEGSLLEIKRP